MKTALIGGIGNVLLGDDALGPYVLHWLNCMYDFADEVELADLGTPALDLTHRILGRRAVIFIDCIASDQHAPGTVLQYSKTDILRVAPAQRLDLHSPALSECLLAAEMLSGGPEQVLLVGVVGLSFEPGRPLSEPVRRSVDQVIEAVLHELTRRGFACEKKLVPAEFGVWWADSSDAQQLTSNR